MVRDRKDDGGGGVLVSREEEEEEGSRGEAGDEMRQRLQAGFKPTVFACKLYVRGALARWVKCIFKELTTTQRAEAQGG